MAAFVFTKKCFRAFWSLFFSALGCLSAGEEASAQPPPFSAIAIEHISLRSPLDIPLILAGNFGEMRSNHFHTGLDIKTAGAEGHPVYAVEAGIVSRVRLSHWGYGLAVYIDHPNGLTSVYAHLKVFSPAIDSLVYRIQQAEERFAIDEVVREKGIRVKRGERIGLSGNSGSSSGPHLHFEIRETATEYAINPLLFQCYREKIPDTTPPALRGMKVYAVNDQGYMIPGRTAYYWCKKVKGRCVINGGKPIDVAPLATENSHLAFAFDVIDRLDGAGNACGIHRTALLKKGAVVHTQRIDYINFDHNRFLNTHQDYYAYKHSRKHLHKQFKTNLNPLSIYPQPGGRIAWGDCEGDYQFEATDVHGNQTAVSFAVVNTAATLKKNPLDQAERYYFPEVDNVFFSDDFQFIMEKGSFYEPLQKRFEIDSNHRYSTPVYRFGEAITPLQKNCDMRIKIPQNAADVPVDKWGIGWISDRGELYFKGGQHVDGWIEGHLRHVGDFVLVADTVAPVLTALDFTNGSNISRYRTLELTIADDFSGVSVCKAFLNDHWVLMHYDKRRNRYILPLDKRSKHHLKKGENSLLLLVRDAKKNSREQSWTLVYDH